MAALSMITEEGQKRVLSHKEANQWIEENNFGQVSYDVRGEGFAVLGYSYNDENCLEYDKSKFFIIDLEH